MRMKGERRADADESRRHRLRLIELRHICGENGSLIRGSLTLTPQTVSCRGEQSTRGSVCRCGPPARTHLLSCSLTLIDFGHVGAAALSTSATQVKQQYIKSLLVVFY